MWPLAALIYIYIVSYNSSTSTYICTYICTYVHTYGHTYGHIANAQVSTQSTTHVHPWQAFSAHDVLYLLSDPLDGAHWQSLVVWSNDELEQVAPQDLKHHADVWEQQSRQWTKDFHVLLLFMIHPVLRIVVYETTCTCTRIMLWVWSQFTNKSLPSQCMLRRSSSLKHSTYMWCIN